MIPLLIVGAVVLFAVYGVLNAAAARLRRHGIHALAWRWLTGQPWHGQAITDRGWFREGRKALTPTGHAPRFHYRKRWQQTLTRTGPVVAFPFLVYDLLFRLGGTLLLLSLAAVYFAAAGAVRARARLAGRKHRRAWIEPAHASLAREFGIPVETSPDWIELPADRSYAKLQLPPGHHYADPKEQDRLARAAMTKLGMKSALPEFQLEGPNAVLLLKRPEPVPDLVTLADVMDAVMAAAADEIVLGLGAHGKPVTVSLSGDSPHVGLSVGSGGGKSTIAAFIIAQLLFKGWISMMLDMKLISHPWARGLPNVAYEGTAAEVHDAMCWLCGELGRRADVALGGVDHAGVIHGSPGTRMLVVAEEMNMTADELRAYWTDELEGRGRSPAIRAMRKGLFAGRGLRQHWLVIGQMLDASSTGGGAARENIAARLMGRYRQNAWKMLCPQVPFPGLTEGVGRVQVVTGRRCTELQAPYVNLDDPEHVAQLRRLAVSGVVNELRGDMPRAPLPARMRAETGLVSDLRAISPPPADQREQAPETAPETVSETAPVGLRQAAELGLVPSLYAARNDRHKDRDGFPQPVRRHGLESLYDPAALAAYYERKSS